MATTAYKRTIAAAWLLLLGAAVMILQIFPASGPGFLRYLPLRCPLNFFFDVLCPTCGLGRSLVFTLQGQIGIAWHYHFLGPILITASMLAAGWILLGRSISLTVPRLVWLPSLIVYAAWGFARNFQ